MSGIRSGSQLDFLSSFAVGETRWVERTGERPPVPAWQRWPDDMKDWDFECLAHLAVPQTSVKAAPTALWKITRLV